MPTIIPVPAFRDNYVWAIRSGDRVAVVLDLDAGARDSDAAISDGGEVAVEVDPGRARRAEQAAPIGIGAIPGAFDEIVLGDGLRRRARFGVRRLAIVHRTGEVPLGDTSVVVVAVAPHRDAAFAAARHAIDETKARAPIWKAERFVDGHVWIGHMARTGPAGEEE